MQRMLDSNINIIDPSIRWCIFIKMDTMQEYCCFELQISTIAYPFFLELIDCCGMNKHINYEKVCNGNTLSDGT